MSQGIVNVDISYEGDIHSCQSQSLLTVMFFSKLANWTFFTSLITNGNIRVITGKQLFSRNDQCTHSSTSFQTGWCISQTFLSQGRQPKWNQRNDTVRNVLRNIKGRHVTNDFAFNVPLEVSPLNKVCLPAL